MKLRKDFIDGQVTCPVCGVKLHARGIIGGRLRWVPPHGDNCAGTGKRVPLEELSDFHAALDGVSYHVGNSLLSE